MITFVVVAWLSLSFLLGAALVAGSWLARGCWPGDGA